MQLMAVGTLGHVIVRIALCKCRFLSKLFVFHIVVFSRVSQLFLFLITRSFWFRLILVPLFAIGLLAGSCPFVHPHTIQVYYHVLPRGFYFCPKHDVPSKFLFDTTPDYIPKQYFSVTVRIILILR